jgi:hypothetical protein
VVQLHLHIVWYICLQEENCSVWSRTWSSVFCSFLCVCLISQGQLSEFVDYSLRRNLRQMGNETSFALSHSTKNAESWLAHYHTSWWYIPLGDGDELSISSNCEHDELERSYVSWLLENIMIESSDHFQKCDRNSGHRFSYIGFLFAQLLGGFST